MNVMKEIITPRHIYTNVYTKRDGYIFRSRSNNSNDKSSVGKKQKTEMFNAIKICKSTYTICMVIYVCEVKESMMMSFVL